MRLLYYFYDLKKMKAENVFKPNQWLSEGRQRKRSVSLPPDTPHQGFGFSHHCLLEPSQPREYYARARRVPLLLSSTRWATWILGNGRLLLPKQPSRPKARWTSRAGSGGGDGGGGDILAGHLKNASSLQPCVSLLQRQAGTVDSILVIIFLILRRAHTKTCHLQ